MKPAVDADFQFDADGLLKQANHAVIVLDRDDHLRNYRSRIRPPRFGRLVIRSAWWSWYRRRCYPQGSSISRAWLQDYRGALRIDQLPFLTEEFLGCSLFGSQLESLAVGRGVCKS